MKKKILVTTLLLIALTACGTFSTGTPDALPTVVLDQGNIPDSPAPGLPTAGVIASGVVSPAQEAQLVFSLGGKIKTVNVSVGDLVEAGQVLVEMEGQEQLEAAVSSAQYELDRAQQAIDDLTAEAETRRIQAMKDIITYEKAVRDAQYALDNFTVPTNQADLDTVAALNLMKEQLDNARTAFEPYKFRPSSDPTREDLKDELDEAQAGYNAAVRRLQYEYDLEVVEAQLRGALEDYEILSAGPDPGELTLAEARLSNAQNQLAAAQAALRQLTLTAPFTGTVGDVKIHSGEWVIPGQAILSLVDLANLRVETTDLSELDIPDIQIGQQAVVVIKALGKEINGQVIQIWPLANSIGGDVVYKTIVELESLPDGLREGMSAEVQFEAGQ